MIISPFRVKKFNEQRHEPKKNWRGKELMGDFFEINPKHVQFRQQELSGKLSRDIFFPGTATLNLTPDDSKERA